MLKKLVILLLWLVLPGMLFAATSAIFITDLSEYPTIHANIYFLDDKGNPIYDISQSDIELLENGESQQITDFNCSAGSTPINISSILSVDVSASMTTEKINSAKSALEMWIESMPDGVEASVSLFNKHNYMQRDFTTNKLLLSNSLNFINGNGSTDFDNAFFGQPAGIFITAAKAKEKPIIVMYTDGEGSADYQRVINEANKIDASVYVYLTSDEAPLFLKEIAQQTDGKIFGKTLENNDVENAYKYILNDARDIEPCKISWISGTCADTKDIEINVASKGIFQSISFNIPQGYLTGFEYPKSNTIDFGEVPIGNTAQRNIQIKALREDIIIDTVLSDNIIFSIDMSTVAFPFTIKKGTTEQFGITYTSVEEAYSIAKFQIISDACIDDIFFATAGGKNSPVKDSLLKVIFPNGNETLVAGSDTLITWSGIASKDTVAIEYTTNGTDWNLISQYADDLAYRWKVPFDISDNCRVRLRHTNSTIESGSNYIIDAHTGAVNAVIWGRNDFDTVYTASADGTLKKWYYRYKKESLILTGQINVFDITQNSGEKIGTLSADQRVKIYNTSTEEMLIDYGHISGINAIDWSVDSRFIIGGSNDGHVLVWKPSNKTNAIVTKKIHNAKIVDIAWDLSSRRIASCDLEGNITVSELESENGNYTLKEVVSFPKYNDKINAIEWISEEKLAVAADNEEVKIWDINQESLPVAYLRNDIDENILALDYNTNQKIICTAGTINGVRVFDLTQNKTSYQPYFQYDGHSGQLSAVSIRFDGTMVASADNSGALHIWKPENTDDEYIALQDDVSDMPFSITRAELFIKDIDFGKQLKDVPTDTTLVSYIENKNVFPVMIDSLELQGEDKELFNIRNKYKNVLLQPGETINILLESKNNITGICRAEIFVYYNSLKVSAEVRADVVDDKIQINQDYHFIGKSNIDTTVKKRIPLLTNISDSEIEVLSIETGDLNGEQFTIESISNNLLPGGETLYADVKFQPDGLGLLSSSINIKTNFFNQKMTVLIGGEGTAPMIDMIEDKVFDRLLCGNTKTDSIKIKNIGNGQLIIKSIDQTDSKFIVENNFYYTIAPLDSMYLPIEFVSEQSGNYQDVLRFSTNINQNNKSDFEVFISAEKDSSGFKTEKFVVEFSELEENEEQSQSLKVYNTGSIAIDWTLPLVSDNFEVLSVTPPTTQIGDSSVFEIKFKGGVKSESPYNEKIVLQDLCGRVTNLNLIATIGSNDARFKTIDDISLPLLICSDRNKRDINIENIGTTPLVLTELSFLIDNSHFEFAKDYSGTIIQPGNSKSLSVEYFSEAAGDFNSVVEIKTNAVNNGGLISFELTFRKEKIEVETSENAIQINGLIQGQAKKCFMTISNFGSMSAENISYSDLRRYELINPPNSLEAGETKDFIIQFLGGNLGITYNEELYITDECGNSNRITLSASVDKVPNASINLASLSAYPGEDFTLPVILDLDNEVALNGTETVSFLLGFNKSIMQPKEDFIASIDTSHVNILIDDLPLQELIEGIKIDFRAYLGDTNYTDIYISNIVVEGNTEILISAQKGDFNLLGVCSEGGNRFVIDTGELQLFQNAPNPVYTISSISFFAIERGKHIVSVYDTYGVKVKEIFNKDVAPGHYEIVLDANDLPSGSYIYVLHTPSRTIKRKLQVLR